MLLDVVPTGDAFGRAELAALSGTESAIYGSVTPLELHAFLDAWTTNRLGSPIARVQFRAGRIDVVWGVELNDGRAVVIKTASTADEPECHPGDQRRPTCSGQGRVPLLNTLGWT